MISDVVYLVSCHTTPSIDETVGPGGLGNDRQCVIIIFTPLRAFISLRPLLGLCTHVLRCCF